MRICITRLGRVSKGAVFDVSGQRSCQLRGIRKLNLVSRKYGIEGCSQCIGPPVVLNNSVYLPPSNLAEKAGRREYSGREKIERCIIHRKQEDGAREQAKRRKRTPSEENGRDVREGGNKRKCPVDRWSYEVPWYFQKTHVRKAFGMFKHEIYFALFFQSLPWCSPVVSDPKHPIHSRAKSASNRHLSDHVEGLSHAAHSTYENQ